MSMLCFCSKHLAFNLGSQIQLSVMWWTVCYHMVKIELVTVGNCISYQFLQDIEVLFTDGWKSHNDSNIVIHFDLESRHWVIQVQMSELCTLQLSDLMGSIWNVWCNQSFKNNSLVLQYLAFSAVIVDGLFGYCHHLQACFECTLGWSSVALSVMTYAAELWKKAGFLP